MMERSQNRQSTGAGSDYRDLGGTWHTHLRFPGSESREKQVHDSVSERQVRPFQSPGEPPQEQRPHELVDRQLDIDGLRQFTPRHASSKRLLKERASRTDDARSVETTERRAPRDF